MVTERLNSWTPSELFKITLLKSEEDNEDQNNIHIKRKSEE